MYNIMKNGTSGNTCSPSLERERERERESEEERETESTCPSWRPFSLIVSLNQFTGYSSELSLSNMFCIRDSTRLHMSKYSTMYLHMGIRNRSGRCVCVCVGGGVGASSGWQNS